MLTPLAGPDRAAADRSVTHSRSYWEHFYASRQSAGVPLEPSAFARWASSVMRLRQPIVEFGFGNARDSLWFARQGHFVSAYDYAASAVERAQRRAASAELDVRFAELDLYDREACEEVAEQVLAEGGRPVIYGRFLIHALDAPGRHNVFDLAAAALVAGGQLFLEFRTDDDAGNHHVFGDEHFRAFLDPALVAEELIDRGATITHSRVGRGLAVHKTEDPHVARLVARFAAPSPIESLESRRPGE